MPYAASACHSSSAYSSVLDFSPAGTSKSCTSKPAVARRFFTILPYTGPTVSSEMTTTRALGFSSRTFSPKPSSAPLPTQTV